MKDIIKFNTSGSGDFDSGHLKSICINKNPKVKIRCETIDSRMFKCRYIVSTSETNKDKINEIYNHIRGIASHLEWI